MPDEAPNKSEIILYQTEDNRTRIEVRLENETVWLTQGQMAELFQTTIPNVSMHIRNVFEEGELQEGATVKEGLGGVRGVCAAPASSVGGRGRGSIGW